ncbi:hypothetical protein SISNIDRAFT_471165 [Sistotremastrum niveocremeum HHB9708]|uniref:Uncharacterized protein n=1 Tax=Sistotremastrum niveocremeum HHB9708 TaxID=1314777 RepID=A0A164MXL9_9AGAM|nr:hypothetical protein SISNIDRAFT_471165 [Sistotremastrum niveocremeum HHB9708]
MITRSGRRLPSPLPSPARRRLETAVAEDTNWSRSSGTSSLTTLSDTYSEHAPSQSTTSSVEVTALHAPSPATQGIASQSLRDASPPPSVISELDLMDLAFEETPPTSPIPPATDSPPDLPAAFMEVPVMLSPEFKAIGEGFKVKRSYTWIFSAVLINFVVMYLALATLGLYIRDISDLGNEQHEGPRSSVLEGLKAIATFHQDWLASGLSHVAKKDLA